LFFLNFFYFILSYFLIFLKKLFVAQRSYTLALDVVQEAEEEEVEEEVEVEVQEEEEEVVVVVAAPNPTRSRRAITVTKSGQTTDCHKTSSLNSTPA
jgi:archaellum component FlaF (FlaF/FlaG flagellin family)